MANHFHASRQLAQIRRTPAYQEGRAIETAANLAVASGNLQGRKILERQLGASSLGTASVDYALINAMYEEQLTRDQAPGWEES